MVFVYMILNTIARCNFLFKKEAIKGKKSSAPTIEEIDIGAKRVESVFIRG
jgi:hypothetical protein